MTMVDDDVRPAPGLEPDSGPEPGPSPARGHRHPPHGWQFLLLAELNEAALARPWGPALMAVGWVHLGFFLVCQAVYTAGVRASLPSLVLWGSELAAVLWVMRRVAGRGWLSRDTPPAVGLIARVWITFLILSFNVATLNTLTGWSVDWFKLVWCTLGSFGFATMAWLFGLRYLIPAFQMYFTGLLMVRFPEWNYLIHGLSWWAALHYLGYDLIRRRERLSAVRARHAGPENAA